MKQLFEFQKKALAELIKFNECLCALDMGLGKTLVGLHWVKNKLITNYMVIVPANKVDDWYNEAQEVLDTYEIFRIQKSSDFEKHQHLFSKNNVFCILSYQIFNLIFDKHQNFFFKTKNLFSLLIDESQALKNHKSLRSKNVYKFSLCCKQVLLLSGDPISKKYENLFMQMKILQIFSYTYKYKDFLNDYCHTRILSGNITIVTGYKNLDHLLNLLHSKSYFLKTKDAFDLPKTNIINIEIPKSRILKTFERDLVLNHNNKLIAANDSLSKLNIMRQVCSGFFYYWEEEKKCEYLEPISKIKELETILEAQKNIVVFYNFNAEYISLRNICERFNKKVYTINGKANTWTLGKWKDELNSFEDNAVCLIQYNSGSTGIDGLQFNFNYMLMYSPTLSGEYYKQALKRINRIGQTNKCFYYQFITNDSIEGRIYKSLIQSQDYTLRLFEHDYNIENKGKEKEDEL